MLVFCGFSSQDQGKSRGGGQHFLIFSAKDIFTRFDGVFTREGRGILYGEAFLGERPSNPKCGYLAFLHPNRKVGRSATLGVGDEIEGIGKPLMGGSLFLLGSQGGVQHSGALQAATRQMVRNRWKLALVGEAKKYRPNDPLRKVKNYYICP